MRIFRLKSSRSFLIGFVIFVSVVLPVKAGILVIANMDESTVVLVDGRTCKTLATLPTGKDPVDIVAGKQLKTFQTGKKPDGIGWAK